MTRGSKIYSSILMFVSLLGLSAVARAQTVDLSTRKGIYFTGTNNDNINLAANPYAGEGQTLQLKTYQGSQNPDGSYNFYLGFISFREGGSLASPLTANVLVKTPVIGETRLVTFPADQNTVQAGISVGLKLGMNTVTVTIDYDHKIAETDETNNTFTVLINVQVAKPPKKLELSMREVVYVLNYNANQIDMAKDPYAGAGKILSVDPSMGSPVADGTYKFSVGVLVLREGGNLDTTLPVNLTAANLGVGPTVEAQSVFQSGQDVVQAVFKMSLKVGNNYVTIRLDPTDSVAESNEFNNSMSVNLHLEGPPPAPKMDLTTTGVMYLRKNLPTDTGPDVIIHDGGSAILHQSKALTCAKPGPDGERSCSFRVLVIFKKYNGGGKAVSLPVRVDDNNGKNTFARNLDFGVNMGTYGWDFKLVLTPGKHDITLTLDPQNAIVEENEKNNTLTVHLTVKKD